MIEEKGERVWGLANHRIRKGRRLEVEQARSMNMYQLACLYLL